MVMRPPLSSVIVVDRNLLLRLRRSPTRRGSLGPMTLVRPDALTSVPARLARDGVAIVADVLTAAEAAGALDALWAALPESVARGIPAHIEALDPNDAN